MEDLGAGLMLNLTTNKQKTPKASFPKPSATDDDNAPMVSFVSKPRNGQGGPVKVRPKPSFVRAATTRKAASTLASVVKPAATPSLAAVTKKATGTLGVAEKPQRSQTTEGKVSRPGKSKKAGKTGSAKSSKPVISSLFHKNPEVPELDVSSVETEKQDVFSKRKFSALDLHDHLKATLEKDLALTQMTAVQSEAIPVILSKRDSLVKSQTGSGKTLTYIVPIVQDLQAVRPKLTRSSGVFALIIVPTRELVLQTYNWFIKLVKPFTWIVPGYLLGGEKKKSEKARIRKGVNILVSTPGRLMDHLSSTKNLNLGQLKWFVLDEADRIMEMGYEKDISKIVGIINQHFDEQQKDKASLQTLMLSATLSAAVEKLAGLTLKNPAHINVSEDDTSGTLVTPTNLKQYYSVIPPKLRLVSLIAFIVSKCTTTSEKKLLIFMSTQDMVDFYTEIFGRLVRNNKDHPEWKINFAQLHGNMAQKDRTEVFKRFRDADSGVLLCTDVAARGLDLPHLDWIVQFNPAITPEDYVHRVGRTARIGNCGHALVFLSPHEAAFVEKLASRGISMEQLSYETILETLETTHSKVKKSVEELATSLQLEIEEGVANSPDLHHLASKGYVSFVRSYAAYPKDVRDVFCVRNLHLGHYAKSFALRDPPTQISGVKRPPAAAAWRKPNDAPPRKRFAATGNREDSQLIAFKQSQMMVSEFQSGLEQGPPVSRNEMKQKRKKVNIKSKRKKLNKKAKK